MTTLAEVRLWGRSIGAVALRPGEAYAAFQYDVDFILSGIELSPLTMPLSPRIYRFRELPTATFHGLPGLLADSLPDRFGNALIDVWLASQGRSGESFNAVERLCYTGVRGMGALEFLPATGPKPGKGSRIEVAALVEFASQILSERNQLVASLARGQEGKALREILQVGTSAGGARAKAVIAWNPHTDEVRTGLVTQTEGFGYWILKFDGVASNKDRELADPKGYGAVEMAYSEMAKAAGIQMSDCRLLEESGRRHFMTRRFDRRAGGEKLHMQSLGALAHYDFNLAGGHSYEQALLVIRRLGLPMDAIEEQFRRMAFNILARNQDDHVKNIAFLMDKAGRWSLSPAFDLTFSYNPAGDWTSRHQMSMNGKRDGFDLDDFRQCARGASMQRRRAQAIVEEVGEAVHQWPRFAREVGVDPQWIDPIAQSHRLAILAS